MELIDAVPARCASLLAEGKVEAALVPVIEYQRVPEILLAPAVCVASRQRVRSVVLASKHDELRKVRSIALDESSRTSAALVKIIFAEFVEAEPEWTTVKPDVAGMLLEHDAALIIGDPGMTFSREGLRIWDLAALWHEYTGLGFVFAMWMIRAGCADTLKSIDFGAALDEGLRHSEEIIRHYEKSIGLSRQEIETYLSENISFRLDDDLEAGLRLYYELAKRHGLINDVRPLIFTQTERESAH